MPPGPPPAPSGPPPAPDSPIPSPRRTRKRPEQTVTADPRAPPPSTTPRITSGDALGRPRNNPPDEEDPPEQTATEAFTLHAFKTTPE